MSELKEYYITTVSNYKIKDIDTIFKTPSSSRPSYENEWFPNRIVTASFLDSFERIGSYYLTDEEVNSLKKDPNILAIEDLSESGSYVEESFLRGDFRLEQEGGQIPAPQFLPPILFYHSLPKSQSYSGSLGKDTIAYIGGYVGTNTAPLPNHTCVSSLNYTLDGTGVDIIIRESWNESGFFHKHPEFYDFNGNCRIQYINWADYIHNTVDKNYYNNVFLGIQYINKTGSTSYNHAIAMASMAAGLIGGFAKNSHIYFHNKGYFSVPGSDNSGDLKSFNVIKNFHLSKSIDPNTGFKRPTIVNNSFQTSGYVAIPGFQTGSKVSGSFYLPSLKSSEGIRIAHTGPDLLFISTSTSTSTLNNQWVNKLDKIPNYYDWRYNLYEFNGNIGNSLVTKINQSGYFSASYSNSILSLTSSYNHYSSIRVYTGSYGPDFDSSNAKGGHFVCEVSGGVLSKTNISKIVVKGRTVYENGNNGIPKTEYGFLNHPPYDIFGIDRGLNVGSFNFDAIFDGINVFRASAEFATHGSYGINPIATQTAALELAQSGVIIVKSAGNTTQLVTQQSLESDPDNPFYDSRCFSQELWDTYIEYAIDIYSFSNSSKLYFSKNTPYRFCCTNDYNNYSTIQAGLINFSDNQLGADYMRVDRFGTPYPYHFIGPHPFNAQGKGVDVYVGAGPALIATHPTAPLSSLTYYSSSHFIYDSINNFNTSSINNLFTTTPYLTSSLSKSVGPLFTKNVGFLQSVGTSGASATTSGLIALYLQLNPGASVKEVRNWLFENSNPMLINNDDVPFIFDNYFITASSSGIPTYHNIMRRSGSLYLGGRDGNILFNPYGLTPNQATFSNIQITKT